MLKLWIQFSKDAHVLVQFEAVCTFQQKMCILGQFLCLRSWNATLTTLVHTTYNYNTLHRPFGIEKKTEFLLSANHILKQRKRPQCQTVKAVIYAAHSTSLTKIVLLFQKYDEQFCWNICCLTFSFTVNWGHWLKI